MQLSVDILATAPWEVLGKRIGTLKSALGPTIDAAWAKHICFQISSTTFCFLLHSCLSQHSTHISLLDEDSTIMAPSASLTVCSRMILLDKANASGIGEAEGTAKAVHCPATNGPTEG